MARNWKPFSRKTLPHKEEDAEGEGPLVGDCCGSPHSSQLFDIDRVASSLHEAFDAYSDYSSSEGSDPYQRILSMSSLVKNNRTKVWVPLATVESSCFNNDEVKLSPRGDNGEDGDELIQQRLQIDDLIRQSLDGVSESTSSIKKQSIEVDDYLDFIYEGLSRGSSDVEKSKDVKYSPEATPATRKAKEQQLAMITGSAHFIKDWGEDEQSEKVEDHNVASTSCCVVVDGDNAMSQYEDVISANVTFSENIDVAQAVEAGGGKEQRKRDLEAVICADRSHSSGYLADQGRLDKSSDEVKDNKDTQRNVITGFNSLRKGKGKIEKSMTINDSKDTCIVATSKCSEINDGNGTAHTQARNKKSSRLEIIKGGANFVKHWGKDEQCERVEDQDACSVATSKCGEINGGNGTALALFTRNAKGRQLKMINARANLIKRWGKNGYSEKDEDGKENDENGAAHTPGKKNANNPLAMIIGHANFICKGEMYEKVEDNKNSCSDLSNCENSASGNKENNALPATRSAKMNNVVRVLTCENKFKGNVKPRGKIKDKVAHKVNGVQAVSQDKHDTNVKRTFHEEADAAIAAAAAMGSKEAISGRRYSATTIVKTGSSQQINHGLSLSHTHDEVQEAEAGLDKVISRSSDAMIYIQKSESSQNTHRSKSAFHKEADAAVSATTTAADVGIKYGSTIRVVPGSPATCNSAYFGMEALYSDSLVTNISDEGDGSIVCLFSDSLVTNNSDEDDGFIGTTTLQACADAPDRLANESEAEVAVITGNNVVIDEDDGFIVTTTLQACANTPDRLAKESEVEVAFEAAAVTGNKAVIRQKSGSNQKTYRRKSPFHKEADAALAAAAPAKATKENRTILIVVPDSPEACTTEKSETENDAANSQTIEEDGSEFDGLDTNMIDEDDDFVGTATLLASASAAGRATDEQPMAAEENVDESIHLDACPATEPFARAPSPATASTNAVPPRPQLKIDHVQLLMPYLVNYGAQTYHYPPPPPMHYQYYHGGVGAQNIPQYYYASAPQTTQFYQ